MWQTISTAFGKSDGVERFVLYLLICFSVVSWALILLKIRSLGAARRNNAEVFGLLNSSQTAGEFTPPQAKGPTPLSTVFSAAIDTIENAGHGGVQHVPLPPAKLHEKVMLRMQHTAKEEMGALRWGAGFLATVGSASPFIGLFGTVWGILATFQEMGQSAKLDVIGPRIASALIATAAGLAVAIPAVMAYNWMLARIDALQEEADMFIERMDFMTRVEWGAKPQAATVAAGKVQGEKV